MRLLVDESIASHELMARLRKAGHQVELRAKAALDPEVWQYAQDHALTLLTANPPDFEDLAKQSPDHHGLLMVYGERDPLRQMRAADIAAAVELVREVHGDEPTGKQVVLNEWRRSRRTP